VPAVGDQELELSSPLVGSSRASDEQVRLLAVSQASDGHATAWLDRPWQGTQVRGGALAVEGRGQHGSQVLIFIDGVEEARLEVDASGRFVGSVEKSLAPGSHQVQVVSGDEGAWSLQPESVLVVSLAPPAAPVVSEPANGSYTNDTTPLFRGTAQPGTKVIISISGTDVASVDVLDSMGNWSVSLTNTLAEGLHSASVRSQAPNGETSSAVSLNFTVDVTPPRVNKNTLLGERVTDTSVSFRFSVTENFAVASVECKLDNESYARCSSPHTVSNLSDGPHVFLVRATDRAGNESTSLARWEWIVDTTPPSIQISGGPATGSKSNVRSPSFTLSANEEVSRFECTLDGQLVPEGECTSTARLFNLIEGPHTLAARAYDLVGLVSQDESRTWEVDLTAPSQPTLDYPSAEALLNSRAPKFSGSAEAGGKVKVILTGTQANSFEVDVPSSGQWTATPSKELTTGPYQLALEVRDEAGNVNSQFSPISFRVDVDPPDTSIELSPDMFFQEGSKIVARSASPRFAFRSTEEGVTYECRVSGETVSCDELISGSRTFDVGQYTLEVRARDIAGNVDVTPAMETWTYTIDRGGGGGLLGCSAADASPLLPLVPLLALRKRRRSRFSSREMVRVGGLFILLGVFFMGSARAQGVDLQRYKPAPGAKDVLGVYSPQVVGGLGLHAGLSANYARNPLVLRSGSDGRFVQSIVADQLTVDLLASISFLDHFEMGLALPFTGQWGPAPTVFTPENATGTGLGDLRLVPKAGWTFLDGRLRLGAVAVLSLPTANNQSFLGTGALGVQPMVLVQWAPSEQLKLLANVGGRFQPERRVALLDLNVGDELNYALGAQWSANSKLSVQANVVGAFGLQNQQSSSRPLEVLAAVGYALPGGMSVRVGGGPGLTGGYGTPNFRLFASIDWVSQPTDDSVRRSSICTGNPDTDDDEDGVRNAGDTCPYEKGDRGDGCPRDEGAAQRVNALAQLFKNDRDQDGLLDDADACPDNPGDKERRGCTIQPQHAGKESESTVVILSFPAGKPKTDSPAALDSLVARVKELLKNNHLAEVHASFPSDKRGATLMQQRAREVSDYLTQRIPELKGSDKLKVAFNGRSPRQEKKKELLDVEFTLSRSKAPKQIEQPLPELTCADQGVAARLMWFQGEVTGVSKDKKVCDGDVVTTGAEAGAVLVLSDGTVVQVAPASQVKLSKGRFEVQQGMVESQNSKAAWGAPEIRPPCEGPLSNSPMISWQKVTGAERYWVQVARGVDFNSDVRFVLTQRTEVSLESLKLPDSGKWYWRVLPVDKEGLVGQPSKIHAFEVSGAVSMR
jgi:hypothetical protein